jgi:membrane protein implicated in regulation of membrane protease activity
MLGYGLPIVWTVLIILFVIVEAVTLGLVAIWFAAGSIFGLIFSLLDFSWIAQVFIFAVSSGVLLFFTKPFVNKHLKVGVNKTNVDSIIGQKGRVKKEIHKFDTGLVKVSGQIWTAISFNNEIIEEDIEVVVMAVEGVKLIVKRSE